MKPSIQLIVGARPNFPKVAPIYREILSRGNLRPEIIHTGQHYDDRMSDVFFRQLGLPQPDLFFGIGGGSQAEQMGRIMVAFEKCVDERRPDLVLVVGDVTSTVACAMVAARAQVPVAHVEAGLRSGDRSMPEELNRVVTDSISDYLFTSEPSGEANLLAEGVDPGRIHFAGNVMIDSLVSFREQARLSNVLRELNLEPESYLLMTMHRPANVDGESGAREIVATVKALASLKQVVFPVHPRALGRLESFGMLEDLRRTPNLRLIDPQGYIEFLALMENAAAVITDSGGIQEETTYLQVPCITLRENTERPVTLEYGTNELMSLDAKAVALRVAAILRGEKKPGRIPPLWDGRAASRIVSVLERVLLPMEAGVDAASIPEAVS